MSHQQYPHIGGGLLKEMVSLVRLLDELGMDQEMYRSIVLYLLSTLTRIVNS